MKTQIGYFASIEQYKPMDALEQAVRAEKVGFDSIWVDDHFHPWYHTNAQTGQAWAWMGAALQATKKAFFSTCITCPIMRYNPGVVAQTFATLRQMYPGRVGIAVGAGEALNEVPVTGSGRHAVRQDMTVEAVEVMQKLWESKEPVSFKGKYYTFDKAFLYTKPDDKVPLYFSGMGPKGARAGREARRPPHDGVCAALRAEECHHPKLRERRPRGRKDPSKMEHAMLVEYSVDADYDKAIEALRFWAGCLVPAMFKYKVSDARRSNSMQTLSDMT